jgi:hypothetical protein
MLFDIGFMQKSNRNINLKESQAHMGAEDMKFESFSASQIIGFAFRESRVSNY